MVEQAWALAHQGGWDEALLVLSPLLVFAGLLWLANRRAARHEPPTEGHRPDPRPGPS